MKKEPLHKHFGIPLSEWIKRTPNELDVDAVGLWQIVSVGKYDFMLDGDDLNDFVRRSIVALINRGASPVIPSTKEDEFWDEQTQYGRTSEEVADNIIKNWQKADSVASEDGLWFALMQ